MALSLLVAAPALAIEKHGPPVSFGVVYPSMTLAPIDNPAYLSITEGDQFEVMTRLPVEYDDEKQEVAEPEDNDDDSYPTWVSYGGTPDPFGFGLVTQIANDQPIVNFGAGFGVEKMQVGYIFKADPVSDTREHQYTFRIGNIAGPALAIRWEDDEKMTAGLAWAGDNAVLELDVDFDTEYEGDPALQPIIGFVHEKGAVYIGYRPEDWKNLKADKDNAFAGLNIQPIESLGLNLHYQRYFEEFVIGLRFIL